MCVDFRFVGQCTFEIFAVNNLWIFVLIIDEMFFAID